MRKKLKLLFKKIFEYGFYLFVFLITWQAKIIIRPAETNFKEISIYASHILLLVILAAFFIWQLYRRENDEPISPLWISLATLETLVLISFFFAPDQVLAFYHYTVFLAGIGLFYILRLGTFCYNYEDSPLDPAKVISSLLAGIFFQATLGIYQFLTQVAPVNKYLGLGAHYPELAGTSVIETSSGRWLRAYGGLDHPNILGGVLAVSLIIAAYLLAKRKMIRSAREAGSSALLFIFYFIALTALFFTFSRSSWLALAAGLLILAINLARSNDRWILGRFLALIFFSGFMLFIIAFPYRELVWARTIGVTNPEIRLEQKSLSERGQGLSEAMGIIKDNWLVGVGVGNYVSALSRSDNSDGSAWSYQPVHNSWLLLATQSGIPSLISFVLFLYFLIKKDRRAVFGGAAIAGLLVVMMLDHWLISLPFGVLFLFLILGLL